MSHEISPRWGSHLVCVSNVPSGLRKTGGAVTSNRRASEFTHPVLWQRRTTWSWN